MQFTIKLPHLFLTCAVFLGTAPLYGLDGWMTNMDKARQQAAEQHKDLFIVYQEDSGIRNSMALRKACSPVTPLKNTWGPVLSRSFRNILRKIQTARGEKKYSLIGNLFHLTAWEAGLPASVYPRLYEETVRNDHDNLSGISGANYVRQMQEIVWKTFWMLKGFEFVAPGVSEIPQDIRSHLNQETLQILDFAKLCMVRSLLLMSENAYTGELEDFLASCQKKTNQILAEALHPESPVE